MPLVFPAREACFLVFSQRHDARIDVAEWARHAERFFATRLAVTRDERHSEGDPLRGVAAVVLTPLREKPGEPAGGSRTCWGRPRTDEDLHAARNAAAPGAGLDELARRCPQVWLVESEGNDDPLSLRVAAILAGVMLGPILSPGGVALFGPKSARERLGV